MSQSVISPCTHFSFDISSFVSLSNFLPQIQFDNPTGSNSKQKTHGEDKKIGMSKFNFRGNELFIGNLALFIRNSILFIGNLAFFIGNKKAVSTLF